MHNTRAQIIEFKRAEPGATFKDVEWMFSTATAAALLIYGLSRRSAFGWAIAASAAPLAYRSLADRWPSLSNGVAEDDRGESTRRGLAGARGIHVRESIRLELPLPNVFAFWRRFENLPLFMTNLERVTELDNGRSQWVAKGPGGIRVLWDAEIINEVENKVIGWRSLPDSDVTIAGSVNFDAVRGGRSTQISVNLQYAPPAGRLGAAAATIFGADPSHTIREDLRRLKQILEAGEVPRATAETTGRSRR